MSEFATWKPKVLMETPHFAKISLADAPPVTVGNVLNLYERLRLLGLRPLEADQYAGLFLICEKVAPGAS